MIGDFTMAVEKPVEVCQLFAVGVAILNRPSVLGRSRLCGFCGLARAEAGGPALGTLARRCGMIFFSLQLSWVNVSPTRTDAMAVPSTSRKTEVVAVQHVIEKSEKPLTPEVVEIRHLHRKFVIQERPYRESFTVQISEDSLSLSYRKLRVALGK